MRILIVRTSSLGDVVQGLPVLIALRRHLPRARIAWVVDAPFAPLLADHPDLDEVIAGRLRGWRRDVAVRRTSLEVGAFIERLRAFGAAIAIDLMGNHKGGLLAALSGAGRTIGLARPLRREPASGIWIAEPVAGAAAHAVDRYLGLLVPLGVPSLPPDFAPERLFPAVAPAAALGDRAFAFLHPGAAWGNKRLPPERWGEVARLLATELGLASVVGAAPGEEELALRVASFSGGAAEVVAASTLADLVGLLRGASLCIAGDTGPLHLAAALGRPVVAVMGPTDPERHGPRGAPAEVLVHRLPCSFCHRRMSSPRLCLEAIAASEIVAAVRRLVPALAER